MNKEIRYRKIEPSDQLKDFVQFFWVFEGVFSEHQVYEQPTTATVFPKLSFQYQGLMRVEDKVNQKNITFRSGLQGQTRQSHHIVANQKVGVVGVCFFPHAIPLLFAIPASKITNYNLEISDVLGNDGKQLEEMIMESASNTERIHFITQFLEKRLNPFNADKFLFSIQYVLKSKGLISMQELVSSNFLSQRHFERRFKEYTGFTPKTFSRIVRFENCISQAFREEQTLTQLAYHAGYYDQSHFIKDFKEFSGQNPKDYFSNHLSFFFEV